MYDRIKRIALDVFNATNPVNVLYGTVEKSSPLEIRIHEKLKLTAEFLDLTETAQDRGLTKNDKVVLLRMQGGHRFLIIDRYKRGDG